jgi:predicted nuclease of predicted toxin-antitoxin system
MRLFLDECVDWRLSRDIIGHEVKTARQMGWAAIKNGELLALASARFDVFITVDQNLAFQQNVASSSLAIIVLRAKTNRISDLKSLIPDLLTAIPSLKPGMLHYVGAGAFK